MMCTKLSEIGQLLLFAIPARYLYILSTVFAGLIILILMFIAFYLWANNIKVLKNRRFHSAFSDLISQAIICDGPEELKDLVAKDDFINVQCRWLGRSFGRKSFIKELMKAKESLSGISGDNLIWLYEYLKLNEDSAQMLSSKKWFKKAIAIQQLARMNQQMYIKRIYKETDNRNAYIRAEAQVAMVKLIGFKGLRFMNIVTHPVTQWQQLCLLQQLDETAIETGRVKDWMQSRNWTVVEFALRITGRFKIFELTETVLGCLSHPSAAVRSQALEILREIAEDDTPEKVIASFSFFSRIEKLQAIEFLKEYATASHLNLLTILLPTEEKIIRLKLIALIKKISPAWGKVISNAVESESAFLNKIAV